MGQTTECKPRRARIRNKVYDFTGSSDIELVKKSKVSVKWVRNREELEAKWLIHIPIPSVHISQKSLLMGFI